MGRNTTHQWCGWHPGTTLCYLVCWVWFVLEEQPQLHPHPQQLAFHGRDSVRHRTFQELRSLSGDPNSQDLHSKDKLHVFESRKPSSLKNSWRTESESLALPRCRLGESEKWHWAVGGFAEVDWIHHCICQDSGQENRLEWDWPGLTPWLRHATLAKRQRSLPENGESPGTQLWKIFINNFGNLFSESPS